MYDVGDIIAGEYVVSHVFTNGGMGVVYKVHRPCWDVDMAMKCPRAELFENDAQRKSFIRECETWMKLGSHPNIISCYYIKSIDSVPSVFMEYADGGSLLDCITSGQLYEGSPVQALRRIIDFAIQTARGLLHAHQKGYIHQDVKPANVLVTASGIAKVSDFGLSKAKCTMRKSALVADGRSMVVSSGGWTPAYGSPEQALGRPLTRRTDIWSWAAMILEMVHGKLFWKAGPFAARALRQLWPWQVFSPKVKTSRALIKILRECLEEREENRPKDFDVIEEKLLVLYHDVFREECPRKLPAAIFMTEATLINRIASFSELELSGGDYFGEVYECLSELHSISPWNVWGDLNYAAYRHSLGLSINALCPIIANLSLRARTENDKQWILNVLMSLGVCSVRSPLIKQLQIDKNECLLNQIQTEREWLRKRLHALFDGMLQREYFSNCDCDEGKVYRSENGSVTVQASYRCDEDRENCTLSLLVITMNGSYHRTDGCFPSCSSLKCVTVDDRALRVSAWICVDNRGWYQQTYTLEDGRLIPYRCDFRKNSEWEYPCCVFISGDAKIMMLYYGSGLCSVWVNSIGGVGNGRNVCIVNLNEFGLIPPETILPGLIFDAGYEYGMSAYVAYRLMRVLADVYEKRRISCRVIRPESSSIELKRSVEGSVLLEYANQAFKTDNRRHLIRAVRQCLQIGILPKEKLMKVRHSDVTLLAGASPVTGWHVASIDEYWDYYIGSITSFEPDKFRLSAIGFKPRCLCVSDNKHGLLTGDWPWTFFPDDETGGPTNRYFVAIVGCENGDAIFGCNQNGSMKWLRRVSCNAQGGHEVIWECTMPGGGTGIEFFSGLQQTNSIIAFTVDHKQVVCVSKQFGTMTLRGFEEPIDYWQMNFDDDAQLSFLVVTEKNTVVLGRDDVIVSKDMPIYKFVQRYELLNVSTNGCAALGMDCWGGVHVCNLNTGAENVLYESNPFDSDFSPCIGKGGAIMSRTGRMAAIVTTDDKLRVYDVVHQRMIFLWALSSHGMMCFDWSERWLVIVHDEKKIEVFQLFWDVVKDEVL